MVKICYRGTLQAITGKPGESIDAARIRDVLRFIRVSYGTCAFKEAKRMLIAVNNESILLLKVFNTTLKDGDTVIFFPICSGG